MDGILIIIVVIAVCHFCLYLGLKNRLNELLIKGFPPITVNCTTEQSTVQAPLTHTQFPGVSVSPAPSTDEELVAVMMAAVAAHESEMATALPNVAAPSFGAISTEATPSRIHEVEKFKYRRHDQRWSATARYENHKRL